MTIGFLLFIGNRAFSVDTHAQEGDGSGVFPDLITVTPEKFREDPADCEDPGERNDPACQGYITIAERTATARANRNATRTAIAIKAEQTYAAWAKTATRQAKIEAAETAAAVAAETAAAVAAETAAAAAAETAAAETAAAIATANAKGTVVPPTPTFTPTPTLTPTITPTPTGSPGPVATTSPPIVVPTLGLFDARITVTGQDITRKQWGVLHRDQVTVNIAPAPLSTADVADYYFTLYLNSTETGFYTEIPVPTNPCSSSSRVIRQARSTITLVRCGLGDKTNPGFTLKAKLSGNNPQFTVLETGPVKLAPHQEDELVVFDIDFTQIDGRRPDVMPVDYRVPSDFHVATHEAASAWNRIGQGAIFQQASPGVIDDLEVNVKAYWHTYSGNRCGTGYACVMGSPDSHSHMGPQTVWMPFPPRGFLYDQNLPTPAWVDTQWTNNKALIKYNPDRYFYFPQIIRHELGHTTGLGHYSASGTIVMGAYNHESPVTNFKTLDRTGMRAVLKAHSH